MFGFHTTNDVNATTDVVTKASHGYTTGDPIIYMKQGGVVNMGLTDATTYYVRSVTSSTISFHPTALDATNNTNISPLTSTGSETHYINSLGAAIFNDSGGAVTLNITGGGSTPTVRNGAGASTTVNNTVTLEVNNPSSSFVGARVTIYANSGGPETEGAVLMLEEAINDGGIYRATQSYNFLGNQPVTIRARLVSFIPFETTGTITNNGLTVTAIWQVDSIVT